jgi:DNA-binding NarL/FixJ family response regulator
MSVVGDPAAHRAVRVLLAARAHLYREALASSLARAPGIAVVGTASDWEELVAAARHLEPAVVAVDLPFSDDGAGLVLLQQADPRVRVLAFSACECRPALAQWAAAGVLAYVTRDAALEDLRLSILWAAGDPAVDAPPAAAVIGLFAQPLPAPRELTRREIEILTLLARDLSNKEIAASLFVEVTTVKTHVHSVLRKLRARSRREAVARARQVGLLQLHSQSSSPVHLESTSGETRMINAPVSSRAWPRSAADPAARPAANAP